MATLKFIADVEGVQTYLMANSDSVTSTFTAAKLNTEDFVVTEHKVTACPKTPYVTVIAEEKACRFVKVIDTLPKDNLR